MCRSAAAIFTLMLAHAALAQAPPPERAATGSISVPWTVSVVHTIDLQKMVDIMRQQQNVRVGVAGTAPRHIYNVTTGLIVDNQGHVVTRLSNLDPQDKEHKLTVTTGDGTTAEAKLIGVDYATGFAVLEVPALKVETMKIAASGSLSNGSAVKILSSDVVPKTITDKVYLAPSIITAQGYILVDSIYSKARGALTLRSDSLLARSDGSVVITPENEIVGMAQYAGFGRAYVYPIELIRDTIAKRVIENKGNVAAGWLGVKGDSIAELSDADLGQLGLQRKAGVIVRQVAPEGPAARAGVMPSDIITRMDEFDIAGAADLRAMLASLPAGRAIKLGAIRNQQPLELNVVLAARPVTEPVPLLNPFDQGLEAADSPRTQLASRVEELKSLHRAYQKKPPSRETAEALRELEIEIRQIYDTLLALGPDPTPLPASRSPRVTQQEYVGGDFGGEQDISFAAGFTARNLNSQLAGNFGARGGILVSKVVKDSPAERSGLKAGDVIVGAQERVALSAAQLQAFLSTQRGPIVLKIVRNKAPVIVGLNLQ